MFGTCSRGKPLDSRRHALDAALGAEVHVPGTRLGRSGRGRTAIAATGNGNRVGNVVGALRSGAPTAVAHRRRIAARSTARTRLTADTTTAIHGLTRVGAGTASTDGCTGVLRRKNDQSDCAQGSDPEARAISTNSALRHRGRLKAGDLPGAIDQLKLPRPL